MTNAAASLTIQPVGQTNLEALLGLKLNPQQCGFIEPISACLEEAKQDKRYTPIALCMGEQVVGFAMYGLFCESQQTRVWFDRFLIGKQFQGNGLGKAFARLVLAFLFEHFSCQRVYLSVYPNNTNAIALYQQLGFSFTGEQDINGEHVMSLERS